MRSRVGRRLSADLLSLRRRLSSRALILTYHRICEVRDDPWAMCVTPENFADQLAVIRRHAKLIRLEALAEQRHRGKIPDRAVVITFDDGYGDNYTHAAPLLARFDAPASIFVTTGQIGSKQEFWWDELERALLGPEHLPERLSLCINGETRDWPLGDAAEYSTDARRRDQGNKAWLAVAGSRLHFYYLIWDALRRLPQNERQEQQRRITRWANADSESRPSYRSLDQEQLRSVSRNELIEIGAHTVSHLSLANCSSEKQYVEINDSKRYLEDLLDISVKSFAYPHGEYADQTRNLVSSAGFSCACALGDQAVWKHSDPFLLPRYSIENWDCRAFESRLLSWLNG